jgi:cytochrome c biogenesis protein CcdA
VQPELEPERPAVDVGGFRQGTEASRWALARFLVGRAVGESLGRGLAGLGVCGLAAAGLLWWRHWVLAAALVALVTLGLLLMRALLLAVLRRFAALPGTSARLRAVVRETRRDVLRELRRIGLPGRTWTLPLLALRLLRRRRRGATLQRLRGFELERAVPARRLDELHLLLRGAPDHGGYPGPRR